MIHQIFVFLHAAVGLSIAAWMIAALVSAPVPEDGEEVFHSGWAEHFPLASLFGQALLVASFLKGITSLFNGIAMIPGCFGIDEAYALKRARHEHSMRYLTSNAILIIGLLLAGVLDSFDYDPSDESMSATNQFDSQTKVALIVVCSLPKVADIVLNSIRVFIDTETEQAIDDIESKWTLSYSQSLRGVLYTSLGLVFLGLSYDWDLDNRGFIPEAGWEPGNADNANSVQGRRLHTPANPVAKAADTCAITDQHATFDAAADECVCSFGYSGDYCQKSMFVQMATVFSLIVLAVAVIAGIIKFSLRNSSMAAGSKKALILVEDLAASALLGLSVAYLSFDIGAHVVKYPLSHADEGVGTYQLLAVAGVMLAMADITLSQLDEGDSGNLYELPSDLGDAEVEQKGLTVLNVAGLVFSAVSGVGALFGAFTLNKLIHEEAETANYSTGGIAAPADGDTGPAPSPNEYCDAKQWIDGVQLAEYSMWVVVVIGFGVVARSLFGILFGFAAKAQEGVLEQTRRRREQLQADILLVLSTAMLAGFKAVGGEAARCKVFESTSFDTSLYIVFIGAIALRVVDLLREAKTRSPDKNPIVAIVDAKATDLRDPSMAIALGEPVSDLKNGWDNPNAIYIMIMLLASAVLAAISRFGESTEGEVGEMIDIFHLIAFVGIAVHFVVVLIGSFAGFTLSGMPAVRFVVSSAVLAFLSASFGAELFNLGIRQYTVSALLFYVSYDLLGHGWM